MVWSGILNNGETIVISIGLPARALINGMDKAFPKSFLGCGTTKVWSEAGFLKT